MKKNFSVFFFCLLFCQMFAEEISIRVLDPKEDVQAASIVASAFIEKPGCPMTRFQAITPREFVQFATQICYEGALSGLSMAAVEESTGKIVGVLITLPGGLDLELTEFDEEKFSPILTLLDEIDSELNLQNSAHHFFLAVEPSFQKKQIGRKLLEKSDENLIRKGYLYAYAEAATPMSQKLFKRFGYRTEREIAYEGHKEGDACPFRGIEAFYMGEDRLDSPLSCKLVIRSLLSQ